MRRMIIFILVATLLSLGTVRMGWSQSSSDVTGTWQGTMDNLPVSFQLVAGGSGTVYSPSQNFSAPVQYTVQGNQITITVAQIKATYTATVSGNQMNGTWQQNGGTSPLNVTRSATATVSGGTVSSSDVAGTWKGTLGHLPVSFQLVAGGSGTVYSPSQNFSAPVQYTVQGNQITITVAQIKATYTATVSGNQMNGTWQQNGGTSPLSITKVQ